MALVCLTMLAIGWVRAVYEMKLYGLLGIKSSTRYMWHLFHLPTRLPNTRIVYFIPPKVWAWKRRRIHRLARLCDDILAIFPFEPDFYARYGCRCTYVGNPTAEEILQRSGPTVKRSYSETVLQRSGRTLAILPGSRESEIRHCLPRMLEAARRFPDYRLVICAAPGIDDAFYAPYLRSNETLTRETYETLRQAKAAVVNSGTATLETALLRCPQVAVYHLALSPLIALIRWAQPLVFSLRYFTLVNIIAGKQVIRELLANDFTVANLTAELQRLLSDETYTKKMLAEYEHLASFLGTQPAAATAAEIITTRP